MQPNIGITQVRKQGRILSVASMSQKECTIVLNFCNSRCPNFFHNYEDKEAVWCGKLERKLYDAGPADDVMFDFTHRKIPDCCPLKDFQKDGESEK